MKAALCPVCWHEETMRAIRNGGEPCRDDMPSLLWCKPHGGPRGQQCTIWDGGHWRCERCDISLPPRYAAVLIDAVLRVSDPDSDSFDGENFADAVVASNDMGRGS